jgi:hypothetical protein
MIEYVPVTVSGLGISSAPLRKRGVMQHFHLKLHSRRRNLVVFTRGRLGRTLRAKLRARLNRTPIPGQNSGVFLVRICAAGTWISRAAREACEREGAP